MSGQTTSEWVQMTIAHVRDITGRPAAERTPCRESGVVFSIVQDVFLVLYMVDEGSAFRAVDYEGLMQAGLTLEQLHEAALDNLHRLAGDTRIFAIDDAFRATLDGYSEGSLLLLDQVWDEDFRDLVSGQYLACAPTRDSLFFCDEASGTGRQVLLDVLHLFGTSDGMVEGYMFRRVDGRWVQEEVPHR